MFQFSDCKYTDFLLLKENNLKDFLEKYILLAFLPLFLCRNMFEAPYMRSFSDILIGWYNDNKRDLPWRHTRNPYLIWISEIILQQTRVAQGYDYYMRFVERFPDVKALAEAQEDEVMKYWQGLGYYSRARNLHAAAKTIVERGGFPTSFNDVLSLKGVGTYTASAICSFAYDMPYAVVDGNVYRLLSRWLGIDVPIDSTSGKKMFAEVSHELLDKQRPALYNQAVMEFGALQCTPASPSCMNCPLAECCVALQQGRVDELPVKQHKTKVTDRFFNYIYVRMGAYTFINKRTGDDIWKNMYELPLIETDVSVDKDERMFLHKLKDVLTENTSDRCEELHIRLMKSGVRHVLSHRVLHANLYEVQMSESVQPQKEWMKVALHDLHKFAVPNLVSQFFSLILEPDNQ